MFSRLCHRNGTAPMSDEEIQDAKKLVVRIQRFAADIPGVSELLVRGVGDVSNRSAVGDLVDCAMGHGIAITDKEQALAFGPITLTNRIVGAWSIGTGGCPCCVSARTWLILVIASGLGYWIGRLA